MVAAADLPVPAGPQPRLRAAASGARPSREPVSLQLTAPPLSGPRPAPRDAAPPTHSTASCSADRLFCAPCRQSTVAAGPLSSPRQLLELGWGTGWPWVEAGDPHPPSAPRSLAPPPRLALPTPPLAAPGARGWRYLFGSVLELQQTAEQQQVRQEARPPTLAHVRVPLERRAGRSAALPEPVGWGAGLQSGGEALAPTCVVISLRTSWQSPCTREALERGSSLNQRSSPATGTSWGKGVQIGGSA